MNIDEFYEFADSFAWSVGDGPQHDLWQTRSDRLLAWLRDAYGVSERYEPEGIVRLTAAGLYTPAFRSIWVSPTIRSGQLRFCVITHESAHAVHHAMWPDHLPNMAYDTTQRHTERTEYVAEHAVRAVLRPIGMYQTYQGMFSVHSNRYLSASPPPEWVEVAAQVTERLADAIAYAMED